jgi:hypothetical protein
MVEEATIAFKIAGAFATELTGAAGAALGNPRLFDDAATANVLPSA